MTQPARQGKNCASASTARSNSVAASSSNSNQNCDAHVESVLRDSLGERNFEHWFGQSARTSVSNDSLLIDVPNPFIANWLLKRFRSGLNQAAVDLLGPSGSFELRVDASLQAESPESPVQVDPEVKESRLPSQKAGPRHVSEFDSVARPTQRRKFRTFQSLVGGECNDLALLAARQVADNPGERFNPLFVHGPSGVGKTHLLEAIYSDIRRQNSQLNVMYLTSESFTNYFTQALDSKTVPSFRQRFRSVDVLLIDNIEFLDSRKKATEEEFLHTIVQIIEHGGQLVVSSDRHPRLLTKHREELITRFTGGLVCRMDMPDEETRRRITASLSLPVKECFTEEALDYVARRCRRSVREIQGALNSLYGHFSLDRRRITVARAREVLGDLEQECRRLVRIADVEKVVCDAFGLTATDLRSKSRRKAVACPRALAMYVARKLTKSAYREIGMYFGGRDHSTVVAAEKRVTAWIESDSPIELPTSCHGRTITEIVQELQERLLSMAS